MKRLCILWMAAALPGFTQAGGAPAQKKSAAGAQRWPIESLSVEGTRIYTAKQVLAIAGLKMGQVAGKPEFEAARDRLVATGAFQTVGYQFKRAADGKGYTAVFQVAEFEQCYPVEFEQLHVSEKDLRADLAARDPLFSSDRLPAAQPVFERYSKWIQDFLAAHGQNEKITGSVVKTVTNEFAIVFQPARNLPPVALVTFRGNSVIPNEVLHDAISLAAIGTPYTEDRFREILNASIRPLYEARGRLRVAFRELRTEPAQGVAGLRVYVTVEEGDSYTLGKLTIDGPTPMSTGELLRTANIKTGDIADFERVNQGLEAMRKAVRTNGYLEARAVADRKIDDGNKTVDVTVRFESGPQYHMGKLTVAGLDLEGENEILRMWIMKTGRPFNPDYPDYFLDIVHKEGIFEHLGKTKANVLVDEKTHTAEVGLVFAGDGITTKKKR
ncbi:MAG: POTRA domain-containing protein [Bryobacteraceae bacterium]